LWLRGSDAASGFSILRLAAEVVQAVETGFGEIARRMSSKLEV
jgi:hypothetical protein